MPDFYKVVLFSSLTFLLYLMCIKCVCVLNSIIAVLVGHISQKYTVEPNYKNLGLTMTKPKQKCAQEPPREMVMALSELRRELLSL